MQRLACNFLNYPFRFILWLVEEKSSSRQRVCFELGSATATAHRSRTLQTMSDLIGGRLRVKLMVYCRRWLSMEVASSCRGARSKDETKVRRSKIISSDEEVEDDCSWWAYLVMGRWVKKRRRRKEIGVAQRHRLGAAVLDEEEDEQQRWIRSGTWVRWRKEVMNRVFCEFRRFFVTPWNSKSWFNIIIRDLRDYTESLGVMIELIPV